MLHQDYSDRLDSSYLHSEGRTCSSLRKTNPATKELSLLHRYQPSKAFQRLEIRQNNSLQLHSTKYMLQAHIR